VDPVPDPLALLGAATAAWFRGAFLKPTRVQREGWGRIASGAHTLLSAPTGSGKTLAAFLLRLDRSLQLPAQAPAGVRTLYVSPLKALVYDVERNLRAPLAGIRRQAAEMGAPLREVRVSIRTGDTPPAERRQLARDPGDLLCTTPESLYLLLGTDARRVLAGVETVIIDEIHALAPGKRGVHLALSLERLCDLVGRDVQRVGLSATQRPLEEVARFLGGDRPVEVVDASERPHIDVTIEVPVEEMDRPQGPPPRIEAAPRRRAGRPAVPPAPTTVLTEDQRGIWPAIVPRLCALIAAHRSTIVFTNSRRLCERLAQRINDLSAAEADAGPDAPPLVRSHHGSIARAQREETEGLLKAGLLRGIVATSSLELGIDMGAVDLVVQIESPGSVSRGLQRIGRAGHQVGEVSRGRVFPKHRGDLLEAAVVVRRMLDGEVEPIHALTGTLDVLAQQIVAMCADRAWTVDELERTVRRCHAFARLTRPLLVAVLDMLAGRYPSDDFGGLRPRLVWDRATDLLTTRRDARLIALLSGGTIPDRGTYGVYLGHDGPRVGELDEEMVHEARPGQTFLLGASTWRIVEITRDRVVVVPAPGEPGRMPFWRGEGPGRPVEVGRAVGALTRRIGEASEAEALAFLASEYRLDPLAAHNLHRYIADQRAATTALPTDRTVVIERFRDELGDFRVCIHTPLGARVHAPWALALEARLRARGAVPPQTLWSDDGLVLRFDGGDGGDEGSASLPGAEQLLPGPEEVEELVLGELSHSALFASHFRDNAARALLLPRRRAGQRTPLWAQRLRSQQLLGVALRHPDFPIVLETWRECLHDVFDMVALGGLLRGIRDGSVRVVEVETRAASPFARSLVFAWVAAYLYEGDAPIAERRAQALTVDRQLLGELLGGEELKDLLDPAVNEEVELELQGLAEERRAGGVDALADLLRRIGDLRADELEARCGGDEAGSAAAWAGQLWASGRAVWLEVAGERRLAAVEDVARLRDGLGAALPAGLPAPFLLPTTDALSGLLARFARTHAPFTAAAAAARLGLAEAEVAAALARLVAGGRVLAGEFRAAADGKPQFCDAEVLRQLRRRTLARLRRQVAPVDAAALARFLPRWHGIGTGRGGLPRLREVIQQLEGLAVPFAELEGELLPCRVADYRPAMLDELGALGEVVWVGRGAIGPSDGRVALYRRDRLGALLEPAGPGEPAEPGAPGQLARRVLARLGRSGASFFAEIHAAAARDDEGQPLGDPPDTAAVLAALWELCWAGLCTNDTFHPLRALGAPRQAAAAAARGRARRGLAIPLIAGGRWSQVASILGGPPPPTVRAHARAAMLLGRYGVVSREAAVAEGLPGGFANVAPVLKAMEEAGKVRRGYFVEGLAGLQFATAAAVEALRAERGPLEPDGAVVLGTDDPANPWGALLPWPSEAGAELGGAGLGDDPAADARAGGGRPRRATGARLVLVGGRPVLYLEAGARRLRLLPPYIPAPGAGEDDVVLQRAIASLRVLAARRRHRELRIEQVNGVPALESEFARLLERAGFRAEPGRLVLPAE